MALAIRTSGSLGLAAEQVAPSAASPIGQRQSVVLRSISNRGLGGADGGDNGRASPCGLTTRTGGFGGLG
jgi:hypothetical protein